MILIVSASTLPHPQTSRLATTSAMDPSDPILKVCDPVAFGPYLCRALTLDGHLLYPFWSCTKAPSKLAGAAK